MTEHEHTDRFPMVQLTDDDLREQKDERRGHRGPIRSCSFSSMILAPSRSAYENMVPHLKETEVCEFCGMHFVTICYGARKFTKEVGLEVGGKIEFVGLSSRLDTSNGGVYIKTRPEESE